MYTVCLGFLKKPQGQVFVPDISWHPYSSAWVPVPAPLSILLLANVHPRRQRVMAQVLGMESCSHLAQLQLLQTFEVVN